MRTGETASFQLGRYEMRGEPGERRSAFRVLVHLGEHPDAGEALSAWPGEIARLRAAGRESKANKMQEKLDRLRELTKGEGDAR